MQAGDRVLTPDGLLGVIVRLHRELDMVRGGRKVRGAWYAIVEHDDETRRSYSESSLVSADAWEDASSWRR